MQPLRAETRSTFSKLTVAADHLSSPRDGDPRPASLARAPFPLTPADRDAALRLLQLIDATLLAPFERPIPLRPFWWRR